MTPTQPSGQTGGRPTGSPAKIRVHDDVDTIRGKCRENESAIILANAGYNVEQNPAISGDKEPDYKIEGRIFDCYAPSTANFYNIIETIRSKVERKQASRIILNLADSKVSVKNLKQQLIESSIEGLEEIIIITKDAQIIPFFPF
ncbi:tRNA nuclease CdiA-2 [Planktothrix tepida]|uniref:tRNA nuclease CdiA C-terminal domain-containing protein n=2 Tax=Planktothrix TaxID=54304 RepID=A0A1J1LMJ9_9CYAN|nr:MULTISPECIES: hypothetical protein [Planktothrix]CAD5945272.1 tRNA nuclease CdiA-2 [Planktothrix tepida]CAD5965718.1 tRNA nuclease CdiA-2 [Planktothrix pseudagardhii]CUR32841.1 hypothetical protein PL9214500088 [Planktothrix tepida PCC 9214]